MRALPTCCCGWLLAVFAAAQDFVPVAAALPPALVSIEVGPDLRFAVGDGHIEVVAAAARRAMGSTTAVGTVHELALLPYGTVIAACENGLFVADAQHPVLDAADLHDGMPAGPVLSVAVDRTGRVWWCTATAFGVVDLRQRFGRVFGTTDGLPAGPFSRLAVNADDAVLLATAAGTYRYQPDVGEGPRVRSSPAQQSTIEATADGQVTMLIEVAARGGASLRQRRRHHHLLQPMVDGVVRGLRPGRHVVEVHAVDRDLRRVRVGEYTISVPPPTAFDPRRLPWLLAGALLVLFASAYRWGGGGNHAGRIARALLRTGVLAIVLLQLLAAVLGYGRSWPFVGFSMYTENWHQNDVLYRPRITGVRADGSRVALHEGALGVLQDGYWQMLAEVVYGADSHREALFAQVARQQRAGELPYVGFVLADGRIRLSANGPVDTAPTVLVTYRGR